MARLTASRLQKRQRKGPPHHHQSLRAMITPFPTGCRDHAPATQHTLTITFSQWTSVLPKGSCISPSTMLIAWTLSKTATTSIFIQTSLNRHKYAWEKARRSASCIHLQDVRADRITELGEFQVPEDREIKVSVPTSEIAGDHWVTWNAAMDRDGEDVAFCPPPVKTDRVPLR